MVAGRHNCSMMKSTTRVMKVSPDEAEYIALSNGIESSSLFSSSVMSCCLWGLADTYSIIFSKKLNSDDTSKSSGDIVSR